MHLISSATFPIIIKNNLQKTFKKHAIGDLYLETEVDFVAAIKATKNVGKPLVIDFTASWCLPCRMIGPKYEAKVAEYTDLVMKKLDVDAKSDAALDAEIKAMPTYMVWKNCEKVDTIRGANEAGL